VELLLWAKAEPGHCSGGGYTFGSLVIARSRSNRPLTYPTLMKDATNALMWISSPYRQQTCVRPVAQIRGAGPSPSPAHILRTRERRSSPVLGHSSALTALGMSR
jgi:hypothetical protein